MKLIDYINSHDMAGRTVRVGNVTVTCDVDGMDPFEYERAVDDFTRILSPWLNCDIDR